MKTLSQRDMACIWHPFTQMKTAKPPIAIVRGQGASLFDEQGREYLDAIASWWMNLHGHAHPYLAQRLVEQAQTLEHVIFADFTHRPAVELAERILAKLPPQQKRFFFSDNGSTAVEVGLKMAIQYWYNRGQAKRRLLALEGSYHGDTFGAMAVGDRNAFSAPFEALLFEVGFIPAPSPGQEAASLAALERELAKGDVAALIVEPLVQGSGGMLMHQPQALDALFAACKAQGCLIIADEVMVGFGRTGRFWATDYLNNKPDIYCLSKGLTGGTMALGATTCTEAIFEAFWSDDKLKALFHGHSCTGNPLACSVALASLDLMEQPQTWDNIRRIMERHTAFAQWLSNQELVENVRQQGVILAFDLRTSETVSYFNSLRDRIWQFFIERGLLLRPLGNTVYVLPPYCITDEQLERVYQGVRDLLLDLA